MASASTEEAPTCLGLPEGLLLPQVQRKDSKALLSSAGSGWATPPRETLRSGPVPGLAGSGEVLARAAVLRQGHRSATQLQQPRGRHVRPLVAAGPYGCLAERGPIRARRKAGKPSFSRMSPSLFPAGGQIMCMRDDFPETGPQPPRRFEKGTSSRSGGTRA